MQLSICLYGGHIIAAVTRCVVPGPWTSIVRGNCVSRDISEMAKQNSARNNTKCSRCFLILCNNSDRTCFFQCFNICQVPWEVLKTAAFGLGFQHLPRDLANVNAWKTIFDPYTIECFNGEQMPGWDFALVQDDANPHILHMLEGMFLLDAAQLYLEWPSVLWLYEQYKCQVMN